MTIWETPDHRVTIMDSIIHERDLSPSLNAQMSLRLSSLADYENLLNDYDTWLFDCDGVLWRGDQLIDGVVQVLSILRERGESPPTFWKRSSLSLARIR